jgi:DNA-binding transcriptional ArsR family regulator
MDMQEQLDALVDPRRRQILQLLKNRELAAGEIARQFSDISRPAVSQHLRVLRNSGLVRDRRDGTSRLYRTDPTGMDDVRRYFSDFWDDRIERLRSEAENEERTGNARYNQN